MIPTRSIAWPTLLLVLALASIGAGCKKKAPRPPSPPLAMGLEAGAPPCCGRGGTTDGGPVDGSPSAFMDAAPADAGDGSTASSCITVAPGDPNRFARGTLADGAPFELAATRAYAVWDGASCPDGLIVLALTEGECTAGSGHRLVVMLDAAAIDTGTIGAGPFSVSDGSNGIQVRYVRPSPLVPTGIWGTCAPSSGTITFNADPSSSAGTTFDLTIADLELGDCADVLATPTVIEEAAMRVTLVEAFGAVCAGT